MKKKLKSFFTLKHKANDGFTLVELIVVIAILAILGGVAVPAYSGYVKKADRAADEVLLNAVNKAFASACAANGTDIYLVDKATASMSDRKVTAVEPYNEEFAMFYSGNEDAQFQVINGLLFDSLKHMFVDPLTAGEIVLSYGGGTVVVTSEQIAALKDSNFMALGAEGLLEQVNKISDFAAGIAGINKYMDEVLGSPEFIASAAAAMGVAPDKLTEECTRLAVEMVKKNNPDLEEGSEEWNAAVASAVKKVQTNAAVLFAAQNSTDMSSDDVKELLSAGGGKSVIAANLSSTGDPAKGMAQAAVAYGMFTAYYNSDSYVPIEDTEFDINNPLTVMDYLNDPGFTKYMNEKSDKDIDAYLSSMEVINSTTTGANGASNTAAVEQLMINGFNDDELKSLLQSALGQ